MMTRETSLLVVSLGYLLYLVAQLRFSISDIHQGLPLRLCFSAGAALNGIKVHVPTK
jgi:hypothetical protein